MNGGLVLGQRSKCGVGGTFGDGPAEAGTSEGAPHRIWEGLKPPSPPHRRGSQLWVLSSGARGPVWRRQSSAFTPALSLLLIAPLGFWLSVTLPAQPLNGSKMTYSGEPRLGGRQEESAIRGFRVLPGCRPSSFLWSVAQGKTMGPGSALQQSAGVGEWGPSFTPRLVPTPALAQSLPFAGRPSYRNR